ncbi:MAG: CDP-alcohol phosphatidyltransferase family protein [Kofleriaceae bacterium]
MRVRYLVPNLITAASLVFGLVSLSAAYRGDWPLAGWMIIYAVMCDRLDGLAARQLKATSEFGVQLDSFADFLNFGLAPAFLIYAFLRSPAMVDGPLDLPFDHGWARGYLAVACVVWVLAAVFRLARFNVSAEDDVPTRIYFGVPTTLAGGLLAIWFLALLKYTHPGHTFGGPKLLGDDTITPRTAWLLIPGFMLVGAYLMASSLRMLKVGTADSKAVTVFLIVNVLSGFVLGFAQLLPEYLVWMPSAWIVVFLVWGALAQEARHLQPRPLFPD